MKIIDILNKDTLSMSFEVFPPKTDTAFASVKTATEEIAKLQPAFMSVTYGAGGGTSAYTLEIARNIKERHGVETLAHLTCVSSTKETVRQRIAEIKAAGLENVMALRGDLTPEQAKHHPQRNLITRALGPEASVQTDSFYVECEQGDFLLLCSDGLVNTVSDQEILFEVIHSGEPDTCLARLVALSRQRGAPDNVTAVLLMNI